MIILSILNFFKKKEKKENRPDICHYSGLPSVSSYTEEQDTPDESHVPDFIDYDGMGNQGRFVPKRKK
tara:strand:- start:1207 stop:1410 length:204 start_codon:yes stop_codon:yes gene_type:complete